MGAGVAAVVGAGHDHHPWPPGGGERRLLLPRVPPPLAHLQRPAGRAGAPGARSQRGADHAGRRRGGRGRHGAPGPGTVPRGGRDGALCRGRPRVLRVPHPQFKRRSWPAPAPGPPVRRRGFGGGPGPRPQGDGQRPGHGPGGCHHPRRGARSGQLRARPRPQDRHRRLRRQGPGGRHQGPGRSPSGGHLRMGAPGLRRHRAGPSPTVRGADRCRLRVAGVVRQIRRVQPRRAGYRAAPVDVLAELCVSGRAPGPDWHYDVVALPEGSPVDPNEVAALAYARSSRTGAKVR